MSAKKNEYKWMVRVSCMTFNHASYIEDAMNGFTMQQTSFPFVCTIVDDASTDGEQEVIKNYLNEHFDLEDKIIVRHEETEDYLLTFARHKTNLNCYFAVLFLKYNHYSIKKSKRSYVAEWNNNAKYIACCEGDDYWIDPSKLQIQVDVLESHPNCSIAFCKTRRISATDNTLGTTIPLNDNIKEGVITMDDYLNEQFSKGIWCFHTSSYLLRKNYIEDTSERSSFFRMFPYGDLPSFLWALLGGNGYYVNVECSHYRTQSGGYNYRVKNNINFAIKQDEKLIEGLKFFDRYTNYKYHKHVSRRVKFTQYSIAKRTGNYSFLMHPSYWSMIPRFAYDGLRNYVIRNHSHLYKRFRSVSVFL